MSYLVSVHYEVNNLLLTAVSQQPWKDALRKKYLAEI